MKGVDPSRIVVSGGVGEEALEPAAGGRQRGQRWQRERRNNGNGLKGFGVGDERVEGGEGAEDGGDLGFQG